jgi:hypothetical protein
MTDQISKIQTPVHDLAKSALEGIRRRAQRAELEHTYILRHYAPGLEFLGEQYADREDIALHVSIGFSFWSSCTLGVTADSMSEAVPILRYLVSQWGLQIIQFPQREASSDSTPTRSWTLIPRGAHRYSEGVVELQVSISPRLCERVQVGVKEVPVFETRCQWHEDATPFDAPPV